MDGRVLEAWDGFPMIAKAAESTEHERLRLALRDLFRSRGHTNVKSPADPVRDMIPDVQGDNQAGKRVYGEAKLQTVFPANDTKEQLWRYATGLPTDIKIQLGVPKTILTEIRQRITAWNLDGSVEVVGL